MPCPRCRVGGRGGLWWRNANGHCAAIGSSETSAASETSAVQAPPIGLTPLPSAEEVQQAAPGGRADPFAPLVGVEAADAQDPTTGLALTGVLLVGDQKRAIVTTPNGSGVICVGADGRCGADAPLLLPTGWSVLSIDVASGCIRFALNDEPQELFCIA